MSKGIFFDLDGTLWDTSKGTVKAANIVLKEHELKKIDREIVDECMGLSRLECAKRYIEELKGKKRLEVYDEIQEKKSEVFMDSGVKLYPKEKEVLEKLSKKYILGIVTNASEMEYVYDYYNVSGLKKLFKGGIAAGAFDLTKHQAIKKLKNDLNVDELYFVGDTFIDQKAAKGNGKFIYASYGFGDVDEYDYKISKLEDLLDILE